MPTHIDSSPYGFIPQLNLLGKRLDGLDGKSWFLIYYSNLVNSLNNEGVLSDSLSRLKRN